MAHLASLARYVTTGSLWAITLAVAMIGDRAPRRLYPGMLAIASAVTAGVLADELAGLRGDHMTESCLDAIEIDREAQKRPRAGKVSRLRAAGERAELADSALRPVLAASAEAVGQD